MMHTGSIISSHSTPQAEYFNSAIFNHVIKIKTHNQLIFIVRCIGFLSDGSAVVLRFTDHKTALSHEGTFCTE